LERLESFYASVSQEDSIWARTWRRLTTGSERGESKEYMRAFLKRPLFDKLKTRCTPKFQATLYDCIKFYPDRFIVAPEPQAYMTFKELFSPAIARHSGLSNVPLIHPPMVFSGKKINNFTILIN